ncbi:FAD:protein FMN transferase [Chryseobacterium suipulveris]|uniref:FAD:protein FMN transferase n=1 Tax=Chryseobacterium suipulveris TaxID=2929800 RepID=A0ABY4BLI9_9FLAO|nr:FAD:protein FMN transferase [Chryseobacterium suipulveris]UOE40054.1 FAD:protein FMN transferase [Chryseobacterium suipulveris]
MQKKTTQLLMGNRFEITLEAKTEKEVDFFLKHAVEEIQRIEELLSTFKPNSQTNLINENAGVKPVKVSDETFSLIERSKKISKITDGYFDITYGSIDKKFWNFDTSMTELPDEDLARKSIALINYKNMELDAEKKTVFLKNKGMRIGFGGIGKGYAAEKTKILMKSLGVKAGIINASGDMSCWGIPENGKPWTIGIAHPDFADMPFSTLETTDLAVATSGNYEKFVMIGGKKYSHTINPKTGFPITGLKSVTILSPNAEISDALATPISIMGIQDGLALINKLKDIECIIIDDENAVHYSDNINFE